MPLYEYVCHDCEAKFETLVASWNAPVACPHCQGREVEKQLSSFAFAGSSGSNGGTHAGCGCGRGGCGCH